MTPQRSSWVWCSLARCYATTGAGCGPDSANACGGAADAVYRQPSTLLLWRRGAAVAVYRQP